MLRAALLLGPSSISTERIDIAHRLLIEMGETADHARPADRQIRSDLFCKEFDLLRHQIGPVMQKSIPCYAR